MTETKGIRVVNAKGASQAKKLSVPAKVLSDQVMAQIVITQDQNQDRTRAVTKTRGLVRGGGKKPWRQKGTGRARAGSSRSPLWKGGGIIFGPTGDPRRYKRSPRSVRRSARQTALATLAETGRLVVISGSLGLKKTSAAAVLRETAIPTGAILAVVTPEELPETTGIRNLRSTDLTTTNDVTAADMVRATTLLVTESAYQALSAGTRTASTSKASAKTSAQAPADKQPTIKKSTAAKPMPKAVPKKPASKKAATKPVTRPAAKPTKKPTVKAKTKGAK